MTHERGSRNSKARVSGAVKLGSDTVTTLASFPFFSYSIPSGVYVVSACVGKSSRSRNSLYANGMPLMLDYTVESKERFIVTDAVYTQDG